MNDVKVRVASIDDAKEILDIYAPYVTDTAISFEYTVPSEEEFSKRIENTLKEYPYIVAMVDDKIVGYAYTNPFKSRAAYKWGVETTIYLADGYKGMNIGSILYDKLEEISKLQNITNMNACITYGNPGSINFHEKHGYKTVAHFHKCGYKNNAWQDMVWMEKIINEHGDSPKPFIPFPELNLEHKGV